MRPFICMYLNCFNKLRFLIEVIIKLQKFISEFQNTQNSFSCAPPSPLSLFWSILVCKIPQFWAKSYQFGQLIILFQKVDTMRLLKICYVLSTRQIQIPIFLGSSSRTISVVNLFHCRLALITLDFFTGSINQFNSTNECKCGCKLENLTLKQELTFTRFWWKIYRH